ncbi:MAG TPA: tRNA pseudouridine(55) synthase TruB [Alphaproteobacteria bacterium]
MTVPERRRAPARRPVHGWIVLDKPAGPSSAKAVAAVRRILGAEKAGHAGTLDPLATGVLPIALGEATKAMPYLADAPKSYRFTVAWGEARDTDDAAGRIVVTGAARPSAEAIRAVLPAFVGTIEQVPPAYSALKVGGRRAYALARADRPPKLAARPVRVDRLSLVAVPDPDHAVFEVRCGKGFYVRSLARDLAVALGTVGHVSALTRTAVGPFTLERAISLAKLERLGHSAAGSEYLFPVETALDDIPALALTESEADRLRRGLPVPIPRTARPESSRYLAEGAVVCAKSGGKVVAFTRVDGDLVRPVRVLNL